MKDQNAQFSCDICWFGLGFLKHCHLGDMFRGLSDLFESQKISENFLVIVFILDSFVNSA